MRDGASMVRAEMRRGDDTRPLDGERRHEHVARLLADTLWWDAPDHEIAKATRSSIAFVARCRADRDKVLRQAEVMRSAQDAAKELGYESVSALLVDAIDAFRASGGQRVVTPEETIRRSRRLVSIAKALCGAVERPEPIGATHPTAASKTGRGGDIRATAGANQKLRAADQALSGRGDSRARSESVAYREAAAGERRGSVRLGTD